jgi:adenosylcobinamide kinase/adenosylcobinamide-phosphate guanylyltransferase
MSGVEPQFQQSQQSDNKPKTFTLVLGGARAGKSDFAQNMAEEKGGAVVYVATAEVLDEEMALRVENHRRSRPQTWSTIEAPRELGRRLSEQTTRFDTVLLDCMTLLVSNVLSEWGEDPNFDESLEQGKERLLEELNVLMEWYAANNTDLIIVSNEVGLGLVPPYPLGRVYRDLLGWANKWLAARADTVYLVVAGIPLKIK